MSDSIRIILDELGFRIKQARINKNFTQVELADIVGKSRTAIEGAEKGRCTLETFISILAALDLTDSLKLFLPKQPLSPIVLAKAQGKQRKRASGRQSKQNLSVQDDELGW